MIRIKDYIFNENEIKWFEKYNEEEIKVVFVNNTHIDIMATFEDIEWNYENFNVRKKLEEVILARNVRIKELEDRINKAIEYIGNGNIGIPKKTSEKFINILKGE